MLHLQESQFNQIFVHYYTNRPGAHESVYVLLYVQAQTRREWVESIVLVSELHVNFFRVFCYVLFHAYFCLFYGLLRFEIACECKSLCTKHVRHCVLRYIRKFKNPRAIVVPLLRSGHYRALGFLNLRMYLGPSV